MMREGGGFFRKLERQRKAEVAAASPSVAVESEEAPPSLQEIKNDKAFWAMLDSHNDPALVEFGARLKSGTPTEADMAEFVTRRTEYLGKKARLEKLVGDLTGLAGDMREGSDKFKMFSDTFGAENVKAILDQGLMEMAFSKPAEFAKIERYFKKLEDFEENVEKPLDKRLAAFCAKHKITDEELLKSMEEPDPDKRQKNVQLLLRHKMTTWQRFKDDFKNHVTQGGTRSESLGMSQDKNYQEAMLDEREELLKKSGSYLAALMTKNKDLREALVRTQLDQEPAFEKGIGTTMGFSEAKPNTISRKHIKSAWGQHLNGRGISAQDFANLTPIEQEIERDEFWNGSGADPGYAKEHLTPKDGKGGFWATVLGFLLSKKHKRDPIKSLLN